MKILLFKSAAQILSLPRFAKRLVVLTVDICFCVLTVWLAYYLRLGEFQLLSGNAFWAVAASILLAIPIFTILGLYRAIFRFGGLPVLLAAIRAVTIYGLLYACIFTAIGISEVPRTIGIIQPILLLLFVGTSRVFARIWLGNQYETFAKNPNKKRILIYGAGKTGREFISGIGNSHEMEIIGFIDDDSRLQGNLLNGFPVFNPDELRKIVNKHSIDILLLALPNISRGQRNNILNKIKLSGVSVRTLPSMTDLAQGKIGISDIHELDIDDLLGREPVAPNYDLLIKNIHKKIVMVTGAGGSIGSELCRQITKITPEKLLLIEQSEFALYSIHKELQNININNQVEIIPLLASVRDQNCINEIVHTWQPHTIYHAAAYKHVPIVECNPIISIKNNLFGTLNIAQAAAKNEVRDFVLISTDKAVRPTNVMGASKRLAEMVLQAFAAEKKFSSTKFSMVRFGNVLDSSGSVVPNFRQQIREGGPITLTHPDVTRFFMTIPEAAQLVIQAGAMATGGDVFVLDMGQPVKIYDLACRLIELSGLTVRNQFNINGDIEIKITGLRPGEKLYEELLISGDPQTTSHPKIMRATEEFVRWDSLEQTLGDIWNALEEHNFEKIRFLLKKVVNGYMPKDEIMDWMYLEQEFTRSAKSLIN